MNKKIVFIAIIVLAIDQISKIIATTFLKLNYSVQVINKFFYLTLCQNEGAAWGLFSNNKAVIIIGTIIAIALIYHFVYVFKDNKRNNIAFGLLIGGLLGNLVDRIIFGYVRDFLDFYIFKYDYPIFNVADICIVIGVALLMIAVIKGEDSNESDSKKSGRKNRQIPSE
jgi:signal peptidase II